MKKDIPFYKVEGIKIAVTRQKAETGDYDWYVYIINENNFPIINVIIASQGYGFKNDEKVRTSTLRHLIPEVNADSFVRVERIDPAVFHLYSEYWVSYYIDGQIYDKKFIFVPDSIIEDNLVNIEKLEMEGILHE
jgi:hypothetical protein